MKLILYNNLIPVTTYYFKAYFNPFSHNDALKHHFSSLKNDLISYTYGFQDENFPEIVKIKTIPFFSLPLFSNHLHPLQVENCDSNLRLLVEEDDNGKFRLERVKRK